MEAIRIFNRYYTNVIGVVDRRILGSNFSLTETRVLLEVYLHPGCNARRITSALNVDEGYLSRTIDSLVHRGLITKSRSTEDRRVYGLRLSEKGREQFTLLNRRADEEIRRITGHLSDEQLAELVDHMSRIRELLGKEGENEGNTR
jgi:DNA-binding MarR family transcriptional regulator